MARTADPGELDFYDSRTIVKMLTAPQSVYYIRSEHHDGPAAGSGDEKAHRLVLTTTSLRNVVLANSTDVLYYEVVTPRWERHLTRVSRLDVNTRGFDPVAELLNGRPVGESPKADESGGGGSNDDEAKRVVALRFYGTGELRPVDDFLHMEVEGERKDPDELSAPGPCFTVH